MPKNVREFQLNNVTGELYTEYDDNTTDTLNIASDLPAMKSALVAINKTIRGGRAAAIGDSITAVGGSSWFQHICNYSNGRLRRAKNSGIGGQTTTQMAARIATDIPKALNVDVVFIAGGTNDPAQGISTSTTVQNMLGMAFYAQSIGADAVIVLPPPKNSNTASLIEIRAALRAGAESAGIIHIDPYGWIVSDDGTPIAGSTSDGTHPTAETSRQGAVVALAQLAPYLKNGWNGLSLIAGVPGAVVTTSQFFPDANSDGTPDGWNGYPSGGLVSVLETIPGDFGNAWRLSTSGLNASGDPTTGEYIATRTVSGVSLAAGDRIAISARVSLSGASSGITCYVYSHTAGLTTDAAPLDKYYFSGDLEESIVWGEYVVGAGGLTSIDLRIRLVALTATPAVGSLTVEALQIWNLTAMGIV